MVCGRPPALGGRAPHAARQTSPAFPGGASAGGSRSVTGGSVVVVVEAVVEVVVVLVVLVLVVAGFVLVGPRVDVTARPAETSSAARPQAAANAISPPMNARRA